MNSSKNFAVEREDFPKSLESQEQRFNTVIPGIALVGDQDNVSLTLRNLEIAIVDDRSLMRDCFRRNLALLEPSLGFRSYSSVDDFLGAGPKSLARTRVVVFCVTWSTLQSQEHLSTISSLKAAKPDIEIVLLSDIEEPADILKAIEFGARGTIPTSVSMEVAIKAMQLVAAGGIYIPEHLLLWLEQTFRERERHATTRYRTDEVFTPRQRAVIDALRRGKPNKIIAYELNMCESTVKVHIRTIMKKLKARNRTEVAFKLNDMIFDDAAPAAPKPH